MHVPNNHSVRYSAMYIHTIDLTETEVSIRTCMCIHTIGVKKKFPRSIRTTGARLKKTGGERKLNGR